MTGFLAVPVHVLVDVHVDVDVHVLVLVHGCCGLP